MKSKWQKAGENHLILAHSCQRVSTQYFFFFTLYYMDKKDSKGKQSILQLKMIIKWTPVYQLKKKTLH